MYYGLKFKDKEVPILSISESTFGVDSLVYNEYMNRKTLMECLLEEVVDEEQRIRLEAQLEVLYEMSIKDIKDKIVGAFTKVKDAIIRFLTFIKDKIVEFFETLVKKIKQGSTSLKKIFNELKAKATKTTNESYVSEAKVVAEKINLAELEEYLAKPIIGDNYSRNLRYYIDYMLPGCIEALTKIESEMKKSKSSTGTIDNTALDGKINDSVSFKDGVVDVLQVADLDENFKSKFSRVSNGEFVDNQAEYEKRIEESLDRCHELQKIYAEILKSIEAKIDDLRKLEVETPEDLKSALSSGEDTNPDALRELSKSCGVTIDNLRTIFMSMRKAALCVGSIGDTIEKECIEKRWIEK